MVLHVYKKEIEKIVIFKIDNDFFCQEAIKKMSNRKVCNSSINDSIVSKISMVSKLLSKHEAKLCSVRYLKLHFL